MNLLMTLKEEREEKKHHQTVAKTAHQHSTQAPALDPQELGQPHTPNFT
jgi:hypothetical protein